jgi:hypothetical protein
MEIERGIFFDSFLRCSHLGGLEWTPEGTTPTNDVDLPGFVGWSDLSIRVDVSV